MFKDFEKFNKIIVLGPQRSGTTVAAQMIASDLGYTYVDEAEYHTNSHRHFRIQLELATERETPSVIQAPNMTSQIHNILSLESKFKLDRKINDDTLVIFMTRNKDDILKSMMKISNGKCKSCGQDYSYELNDLQMERTLEKYKINYQSEKVDENIELVFHELTKSDKTTIDISYSMWYGYQRQRIKNSIELEYESLSQHPMWIPKEQRINFHKKQTRL